ncbi:MAG: hypothetical protein KAW12_12735 [Candidatus Aminicenantes bacterium]|nr:hypothetical protein [Candidatus Aminicenantes bacterium]
MKKYLPVLAVIFLILVAVYLCMTVFFNKPLSGFPIRETGESDSPFMLYFYFSRNSCSSCMEVVNTLNRLTDDFPIFGVVPEQESHLMDYFKKKYRFPIITANRGLKKFAPIHNPTLMGVLKSGRILFVLPGVSGQNEYLENFLYELYRKALAYSD